MSSEKQKILKILNTINIFQDPKPIDRLRGYFYAFVSEYLKVDFGFTSMYNNINYVYMFWRAYGYKDFTVHAGKRFCQS